jgi:hypothetical protein
MIGHQRNESSVQLNASLEFENGPTTRVEGLQTMSKGALAWMISALTAAGAAAETPVTTSGTTTAAFVPVLGPYFKLDGYEFTHHGFGR